MSNYARVAACLCIFAQFSYSDPSLIIPLGSYMENTSLAMTYVSNNQLYHTRYFGSYSTGLDCWQEGHDIYTNHELRFSCNTTVNRDIVNAADFLYSALIPYGSYLESCTGILRTRESINSQTRSYLYASCSVNLTNSLYYLPTQRGGLKHKSLISQTVQPWHLTNHLGKLKCTSGTKNPAVKSCLAVI